jgi:hypothetical protein
VRRQIHKLRLASYFVFAIRLAIIIIAVSMGAWHKQAQAQNAREARLNKTIEVRQKELRDLERKKERAPKPPENRLLYQQLKQDFEQLQVINNDLSMVVASAQTLDYEQIRDGVAEIRRRALRLKANLSLPEPAKGGKPKKAEVESTPESFKAGLNALESLIKRFVENPVFQQLNVVNVDDSLKASRDLEAIIKLSEELHKGTEVLTKTDGKKP